MGGKSTEERLASIESKLDLQCLAQADLIQVLFKRAKELDDRIIELELWRAETKGGWAVLSALGIGSSIVTLIMAKLTGLLGG